MVTKLSMKMRMLMELMPRRAAHIVKLALRGVALDFDLALASSQEDPKRYTIASVTEIDRRTALETLRTSGLASVVLPRSSLDQEEQNKCSTRELGTVPRIRFVRLTSRQTLSMFDIIRKREPDVRKLHAHLEAKNFDLIEERARGSVIRAYAADGVARGEGIVVELPHEGTDGAEASFHVSIKDTMTGEGGLCEVRTDYVIRRGKQTDTYTIEGGRAYRCGKKRSGKEARMDVDQTRLRAGEDLA
jgi:hypothetical protein